MEIKTQRCNICEQQLPLENFHADRTKLSGKHYSCKKCRKDRYEANIEEERRLSRERHRANADRYNAYNKIYKLRKIFNLTPEQLEEKLLKQKFLCAICKLPENGKRLAIDHDHETGKIRGLLCQKCNRALGLFDDSIAKMEAAITYIKGDI